MKKLLIALLIISMFLSSSVAVFAETNNRGDNIVLREQPPENWQYGGEIFFNKGIVGATTAAVSTAVSSITTGNVNIAIIAGSIVATLAGYGVSNGNEFRMYVKKVGFYKQSTDNSGFPFYCQDVISVYMKKDGQYIYLYTYDDFYHSYTPTRY